MIDHIKTVLELSNHSLWPSMWGVSHFVVMKFQPYLFIYYMVHNKLIMLYRKSSVQKLNTKLVKTYHYALLPGASSYGAD